jgi:chromosome segregation ATPase
MRVEFYSITLIPYYDITMKAIITKEDVARAIGSLKAAGKKPTIAAIHAALANKGSLSTVVKLKAEIEADAVDERDSEEGLRAFRELWSLAVAEGRKQMDAECQELREARDAMTAESQKLDGEVAAANERVAELETQRDGLHADLAKANEQVTAARANGEQNAVRAAEVLERMATMQEAHAKELADLRQQLSDAQKAAHSVELRLARAEAKLEK